MKLKDICKDVALLLQLEDCLQLVSDEPHSFPRIPVTELTWQSVELLKRCANAAVRMIAQGYIIKNPLPAVVDDLEEDMQDFDGKLACETIAYLAASEYAAIVGMPAEASLYLARFKDEMRKVLKTKAKRLFERRWY
jgi:hypothetical protein